MTKIEHQIAAVASTIRHDGDYGECLWSPEQGKVFWVGGDGDFDVERGHTGYEEAIARFMAIDGVNEVEIEAETSPIDSPDAGGVDDDGNHWLPISYDRRPNNRFLYEEMLASYAGRGEPVPSYVHQIFREGGIEL